MKRLAIAAVLFVAPGTILAQSSTSYRLEEQVFNAGGRPSQAVVSNSPSYRLSLDSIGDPVASRASSGASFGVHGGFVTAYPPPGEVSRLTILADGQTLTWDWEPASTAYNVYSGGLSTLPGGYGDCAAAQVAGNSWVDPSEPSPGGGTFYLVTGENLLTEEGTKGHASTGVERDNSNPCP